MSKAIKRAIAKRKEENARRRFEEDSKYIIGNFNLIASTLEHSSNVADKDESDDDDASSVSSFSTTATTDDNPGAGWTVDKYFYQPAGRRIEKTAFRIAMPHLSTGRIFQYIKEHLFKGELNFDTLAPERKYTALSSVYIAGLDTLFHKTQ